VKYFFYTFLFVASLGTAGAVMNPALVQQGAALIGWKLPRGTADTDEKTSDEDQLSQFLAQYPFANKQHRSETVVPPEVVPPVVFPPAVFPPAVVPPAVVPPAVVPAATTAAIAEPVPPPSPPDYAIPAVLESPAPPYSSPWDSTVAVPTPYPPTPSPTADWSGPAQPFQEPTPAPLQSIYATVPPPPPPPHAAPHQGWLDPIASVQVAPSQEMFLPPAPPPPPPPPLFDFERQEYAQSVSQPPQPMPPTHSALQTQAVLIEDVPVYGTEMVARVGTQVILMGDILPKLRRVALKEISEKIKQMPEEERAKVAPADIELGVNMYIESLYPEFLQEQILCALVYGDYERSKSKAEKDMFNEKIGEEFDRNEVPEMMKEFNVDTVAAVKRYLETRLGSSLERERRLWIREQIVRQWIQMSVQHATKECTHDEMREFYEENMALFTSPAKAQWQEMVVFFSSHPTEQEALHKIRWMGNQVAGGAPFEEIAKANSDGFTASKGGLWDWTIKGSLASAELEQAIFSQPLRQLSPTIIKSNTGFHIIRVVDRREDTVVPLVDAQGTIREKIRNQRIQRYQAEYFTDLRRSFPIVVVKEQIDFNINSPRTANAAR